MNAQVQNLFDNVVVRARDLADGTVDELRSATLDVAGKVSGTKGSIHDLGTRGLKLNEITFRYLDKLIKLQLKFVEGSIEEGAKRLKTAANADTFVSLFKDQVQLLPMTRERIVKNARETMGLVLETRDDVVAVFKPVAKKPARKVAAKAPAKKAARKPAAKKAVRKAPAKKAAPKAAPAQAA
jgi:phasin family protein